MVSLAGMRAPLFVPATRPDRFAKAAASEADGIILDLEDAVGPREKDAARDNLATGFADVPVLVRVNGAGTPWHDADLDAVRNIGGAGVLLPKAERWQDTATALRALEGIPVVALIETAAGLARARTIARLPGVVRLAFGSIDYCADLGCDHVRDALLSARAELVLASRLAGLAPPLDGVTTSLNDPGAAADDSAHARSLGMTGKLCIHPRQVAQVMRAFAPSDDQIAWARKMVDAPAEGAHQVDGVMVDAPVRARARAILAAVRP